MKNVNLVHSINVEIMINKKCIIFKIMSRGAVVLFENIEIFTGGHISIIDIMTERVRILNRKIIVNEHFLSKTDSPIGLQRWRKSSLLREIISSLTDSHLW